MGGVRYGAPIKVERDFGNDFIPFVEIDSNQIATQEKNGKWKYDGFRISVLMCEPKITLSTHIEEAIRNQAPIAIWFDSPSEIVVKFIVKQGNSKATDNDGLLKIKPYGVTLKTKTDFEINYGNPIALRLSAENLKENAYIDFYASDDGKGFFDEMGLSDIHCGRILILSQSKDMFTKNEYLNLISEINHIKKFAESRSPSEYSQNYCMQAAERGLSELLNDSINFYAVHRKTHIQKNSISLFKQNAITRANKFKNAGYINSSLEFNDYIIDHEKRKLIKDYNSYADFSYNILNFNYESEKKLKNYFIDGIKGKFGYHVYYLAVTEGFHTLLIIINNTNSCETTYEIFDQYGKSSSFGNISEIAKGILKQSSWTFASSCLMRYDEHLKYNNKKHEKWDSTKTFIWKIQRK